MCWTVERHFDYYFLRDYLGGESEPVMVSREKRTKVMIAHVVPFKGERTCQRQGDGRKGA